MSAIENDLDGYHTPPIMSAYSLIIKFNCTVPMDGTEYAGLDMKRLSLCAVIIMLIATAASLPFVLNAGFGQAPQGRFKFS